MIYDFGLRLQELREKTGYTQEQVADLIGISRSTIGGYESNISKPRISVLRKLATLYKTTTDYLLDLDPHKRIIIDDLTPEQENILESILHEFEKARNSVKK